MYSEKAQVFVVDDDPRIRSMVERMLLAAGYAPRGFPSAGELLECPTLSMASCLILDVKLPDLDGLELQRRLQEDSWAPPIVFITGYGDIPMSVQAMRQGAVDFLPKPFTRQQLLDAVAAATARHSSTIQNLREHERVIERVNGLTRREKQVFERVCAGMLNREIAAELGTSEITVKLQRAKAMKKLEVENLAEMVRVYESYREALTAMGMPG